MRSIAIDLVSDLVCPWCLIGSRRLDQALLAFPDVRAEVVYHPFLLDPSIPDGGVDLRDRLAKKYGMAPARMFDRVEAAARESGIPLDFAKVTKMPSTVRAHTLLRHAAAKGTQRNLAAALFDAYFLEGRDIGDPTDLATIAALHGFAPDEATALLRDQAELEATREVAQGMAGQGISGVPFFVLDGKLAFSGAQPVETIKNVIVKALEAPPSGD